MKQRLTNVTVSCASLRNISQNHRKRCTDWFADMFCRTHRVDVQSHGAAVHGINGGQAAGQRCHQRVVGGVDRRFAFWVLQGEVRAGEAVRLGEN